MSEELKIWYVDVPIDRDVRFYDVADIPMKTDQEFGPRIHYNEIHQDKRQFLVAARDKKHAKKIVDEYILGRTRKQAKPKLYKYQGQLLTIDKGRISAHIGCADRDQVHLTIKGIEGEEWTNAISTFINMETIDEILEVLQTLKDEIQSE